MELYFHSSYGQDNTAPFHILKNSSYISHPTIRYCMADVAKLWLASRMRNVTAASEKTRISQSLF
jgi:hypothetical protein